jgi:hypothetical protein
MAKIFISYSRSSKDIVEELVQDREDHDVWFDQHLTGGQTWWNNILSEIRNCEIFVAALTPDSLESRACQREMKYAGDLQRILLPVRLSDQVSPDSLPPGLSELQWVDYTLRNIAALKSLQRTQALAGGAAAPRSIVGCAASSGFLFSFSNKSSWYSISGSNSEAGIPRTK